MNCDACCCGYESHYQTHSCIYCLGFCSTNNLDSGLKLLIIVFTTTHLPSNHADQNKLLQHLVKTEPIKNKI